MLRLFSYAGAFLLLSLLLALATDAFLFRLITVVTGLGVVGLYLFLLRSRGPLSGTQTLTGLVDEAEVHRDEQGTPHITARSRHDLFLAQGFVTAQDRFWQMELNRRTAAGRLAEIFGESHLDRDRHLRSLGLYRAAQDSLALYSEEARGLIEAYAAGVNAYLSQQRLPPEFTCLRLKPEPWTVVDSLAVAKLLAYEWSSPWTDDLIQALLTLSLGLEKAPPLFNHDCDPDALHALAEMGLPYLHDLLRLGTASPQTLCDGSSWVIGATRTQSGAPILGSALQTAPQIPTPLYPCHLIGPDRFDVSGATLPGIPGIFSGRNQAFAWSFSRADAKTHDLYLERPDPAAPGLFAFQGGWEPARRLTEEIRVRGRQEPITHEVLITRHGPILAADSGCAIALCSTVLQPSTEIEALLQINQARTYGQFQTALRQMDAPALSVLYAGQDGSITQSMAGAIPLRPCGARLCTTGPGPLPGWTGRHEWAGFASPESLPAVINPPDGVLVAPGLRPAAPYRAQRLKERLLASTHWNQERVEPMLTDAVNLQARALIQPLLTAVQEGLRQGAQPESLSDLEKRALLLLSGWEHDEPTTSAPALLWHQWYLFIAEAIFRPQMGLALFHQFAASRYAEPVTDRLLRQVASGEATPWLDMEGETGLPRVALRAFRRAVALLAAKHGTKPEQWAWGREHHITFTHVLSRKSPLLAHLLNLGPYSVGGSQASIDQSSIDPRNPFTIRSATTYRYITDLGVTDDDLTITSSGASAHPLSPFFADQLPLWLKGEHARQPLRPAVFRKLPRLRLTPK